MAAETLLTRIFNYIKESVVIKRLEWQRVGNKYWSPVQAGTGFLEKLLTFLLLDYRMCLKQTAAEIFESSFVACA